MIRSKHTLAILAMSFILILTPAQIAIAQQTDAKPLSLPVALPPGPSTWLLGQPYGNTVGAYNLGQRWYRAGQGLHFGLDLAMPCGTPLIAVADGEVAFVDDLAFGSGPHNLILQHPDLGLTTLYGHLLERPSVAPGQIVQRGQTVALSGDPDALCDSRPHLHLEIRSLDYGTAFNPVDFIEASWHSLATIGGFSYPLFQQNLVNTRQWMNIDDQPIVRFGSVQLNTFANGWPPMFDERAPFSAGLGRALPPLPADSTWALRRLGFVGCCTNPWWHPGDPDLLYVIDGTPGETAAVIEWRVAEDSGPTRVFDVGPPPLRSPDWSHIAETLRDDTTIRNVAAGTEWTVTTNGARPAISADNSRLLWIEQDFSDFPIAGDASIWISNIDGSNARQLPAQPGTSALWLDGSRVLFSARRGVATTLIVYDDNSGETFVLGSWDWMRGFSVAPGGERLLFYVNWQTDSAEDGVYSIATHPDAQAERLPWFGAWRWRDRDSVYYIPFNTTTDRHSLTYYHIPSGENRALTDPDVMPFTVGNGDWAVSADGRRIVFYNTHDRTMWLLENSAN